MRDGGRGRPSTERCRTLQTRPSHCKLFPNTALVHVPARARRSSLVCHGPLRKFVSVLSHLNLVWLLKPRPMSQTGFSRPLPWFPHWQEQLKKRVGVSHVTWGKFLRHVISLWCLLIHRKSHRSFLVTFWLLNSRNFHLITALLITLKSTPVKKPALRCSGKVGRFI